MNQTFKRYALSCSITFVTAFALAFLTATNGTDAQVFTTATIFAVVSAAARAGVKAVVEYIVQQNADLPHLQ